MDLELIGKIVVAVIGTIGALIGLATAIIKARNPKKSPPKSEDRRNIVREQTGQTIQIQEVKGSVVLRDSSADTDEKGYHGGEKLVEDKESLQSTHIRLARVYTSVFAEDGQLQSETIRLEQSSGSNIKGVVELIAKGKDGKPASKVTYSLVGTFDNKVLTGEYFSKSESNDERGTINLRLISEDILSGFCSFSKTSPAAEDGLRMSPYVWVAGENIDLINGSYDFCAACYKEKAECCCASEEVDMPVLLHDEASIIQSILPNRTKRRVSVFSTSIDNTPVRQIKREEVDGAENISKCHFFDYTEKKCRIYSKRPVDCRLFPFDIVLNKSTGEYEVGYYPTVCNRQLPDYAKMKEIAHILRPYFFLLYPYAHITTLDTVCERLKDAEFKKIAILRDFVF